MQLKQCLKGDFSALSMSIKMKGPKLSFNLYFDRLENEEQIKFKLNRKKIMRRIKTNQSEKRKSLEKIKETKRCFIKNINKIYTSLAR